MLSYINQITELIAVIKKLPKNKIDLAIKKICKTLERKKKYLYVEMEGQWHTHII